MTAKNTHDTTAGITARTSKARSRLVAAAAVAAGIAAAALVVAAIVPSAAMAATHAAAQLNCAAAPSSCGLPDATNTGVPAGMTLKTVPGQVSSGPGWSYDPRGWVEVSGNGANLSGLYIPYNLDISASNVTINDVQVVTSGPSSFGISLRHTANVTIENSTISGVNATTGRVADAIDDIYGDSTGMVIKDNNISDWRTGVQVSSGLVTGNYIHTPGFAAGDHTNGIYDTGSTQPLTISGNTILNSFAQTDDITLEASSSGTTVANKTITGNLLAGGGYSIYAGASLGNTTANIIVTGNRFSTQYFPQGGMYGPAAYYNSAGTGNTWTGNTWDTTGQTVAAPSM
jgi:Right handed beta helix region